MLAMVSGSKIALFSMILLKLAFMHISKYIHDTILGVL